MKNRQEALSKLAEGLDQIIADHAERLAQQKAGAPEEEMEGEEGMEEGEEMPSDMSEAESLPEEAEGEMPMAEEGEMPMAEEGEEMPEGEEDDEMAKVKQELADRLKSQPKAIRR